MKADQSKHDAGAKLKGRRKASANCWRSPVKRLNLRLAPLNSKSIWSISREGFDPLSIRGSPKRLFNVRARVQPFEIVRSARFQIKKEA